MLAPQLDGDTRRATIGQTQAQAIPLAVLVEKVVTAITQDPQALLCERPDCERCNAVRESVKGDGV
jgi:hypothetical protein